MLEQVHEVLWIAEGGNVSFYGAPYPTRSVIVRLENGDLWIWSPVKLTMDLRAEVDRLGSVRHLVSPNKLHQLYLQEWKSAYPEAVSYGGRNQRSENALTSRSAKRCGTARHPNGCPTSTRHGFAAHSPWTRLSFFTAPPRP